MTATRAAASSIASGTPSRRRHTSATASAWDASSENSAAAAWARSAKSRTTTLAITSSTSLEASGSSSDRTTRRCSPSNPRKPYAAGRQDPNLRTGMQDAVGETAGRVQQVLTVVQNQQQHLGFRNSRMLPANDTP